MSIVNAIVDWRYFMMEWSFHPIEPSSESPPSRSPSILQPNNHVTCLLKFNQTDGFFTAIQYLHSFYIMLYDAP